MYVREREGDRERNVISTKMLVARRDHAAHVHCYSTTATKKQLRLNKITLQAMKYYTLPNISTDAFIHHTHEGKTPILHTHTHTQFNSDNMVHKKTQKNIKAENTNYTELYN